MAPEQASVDLRAAARSAIQRAHLTLDAFKRQRTGRPEEARAEIQAEIEVHLTEAQAIRLTILADVIEETGRTIVKATSRLEHQIQQTHVVLEQTRSQLEAAAAQGARTSDSLVRWTKYMVIAISIQAVFLFAQVLIAVIL